MNIRHALKDILYGQVERLAKGMASAKRLELIELLCQAPKSVETLAAEAGISVKLASAHLKELRLAHLVDTQRQGRHIIYHIACPEVAGLLLSLRLLAKDRLLETQHALLQLEGSSGIWPAADREDLCHQAKRGEISVIDVRPLREYEQRHFPCATSLPLPELAARLADIARDKPVVVCGRGMFCQLSVDAVQYLGSVGYQAFRWKEGGAEWLVAEADSARSMFAVDGVSA
jgi:rhodanese-related sulfurtransferase/DNA-binding transcriptional ArsR family regulator